MAIGARHVTGSILVLAGIAVAAFFGLLLGIADCGPGCVERGERAPVYALIGGGVLLLALGLGIALRQPIRLAFGSALLVGGGVATAGALWSMLEGARGAMAWATLAVGLGCAAIGAWLRFWRAR